MYANGLIRAFAARASRLAAISVLTGAAALTGSAMVADRAAAEGGPEFSANVALTTDYIFRGFSQTDEGPAIQGGMDMTWNIFYVGVWGSNLDFGGDGNGGDVANIEIDVYAGITPKLGPVDLDFGVIYYAYPQAQDATAELDYVEFKAGASTALAESLTVGATVFYSPEYTGAVGENWVLEGKAELALPKTAGLSPSISALVGTQFGDEASGGVDYTYWNAGLSVGFREKFSLDVRYWDTDRPSTACAGPLFQCDERVVGTLSASF